MLALLKSWTRGDRLAEELDPAPVVLDPKPLPAPRPPLLASNYCPRPRRLVVGALNLGYTEPPRRFSEL